MELHLFEKATYITRRARLKDKIGTKGIILLPGNNETGMNYTDNQYHFRQDSSFLYFFGLDIPGLMGVIDLDEGTEIIFGDELTIDDMIWTGPMPALTELAAKVGITTIAPGESLKGFLSKATESKRQIHFLPQYRDDNKIKLAEYFSCSPGALNDLRSQALVKAVIELREIKEPVEIEQLEKAVSTSAEMHFRALEFTRAGMKEYEAAAQIEAVAKMRNSRFAYPLIFTVNGEILHNHGQHNTIEGGRLILCDAGAENEMRYAGDLTRTFPANKRFSGQQKEIYETVLKAMDHAISLLAPGITYMEVHRAAAETIVDGLKAIGLMKGDTKDAVEAGAHALFFPHGLGHMLGLDVHDMEALGEDNVGYSEAVTRKQLFGWKSLRLGKELQEGFVLTVEPGVYFIPGLINKWSAEKMHTNYINYEKLAPYHAFGGIRVEDNYSITSTGSRKLGKHLPKTIAEIEALRQ